MPSAEQIEARKAKARERMEQIKQLFLTHGWVYRGETKGYEDSLVRHTGPDTPENRVTKLVGAGQLKLRRGEQYARVGFVFTKVWRFDGQRNSDRVQIKNTDLAQIQAVLDVRSPRRE